MPDEKALKCPNCSAPLDYPAAGQRTAHCPYCNATILLPELSSPTQNIPADFAAGLGPLVDKALELAQISGHLQSGNKIQAIKIFRQSFGTDLGTAQNAVENIAAGRPTIIGPAGARPGPAASRSKPIVQKSKSPVALILVIILVAVALTAMRFRLMRQHITTASSTQIPTIILPPAAPPAFAHMTLEFGSEGIGPGQFKDPRSIATDGAGRIYVGEFSGGRVQVFDKNGNLLKLWSIGQNQALMRLSASLEGTLYAVTPGHILCFEGITGLSLGEAATTIGETQLNYTDAVATPTGNIYAIGGTTQIIILNSDGTIKTTINAPAKVGEDVSLDRIAVNGLGEIYALDRSKGIFKFAPDGRFINRFGSIDYNITNPDNIVSTQDLAIDGQGRVYVASSDPAIRVFDSDGRFIDSFGGPGLVFALAIDDHDQIFACFRNDHVIRKFVVDKK